MKASNRDGRKIRRSIPWALHMAIVRLQGAEELEYNEACVRAAALIEEGGEGYREAVKAEANRLYKSRFMGELNKSRTTWHQKGFDGGFRKGRAEGYESGREAYQITYPCSGCGGDLFLKPGNKDTKSAIEFLKSQGWAHSKCIESSKSRG